MKIIKTKSNFPYALIYSNWNSVHKQRMSFKTILEVCDFAISQGEYVESCDGSVVSWVEKNKHAIEYKGGWREFCV